MIVTPRFVFLHLHKSGGTFINDCLLRFVPNARQVGYHLPREQIPAQYRTLPVLGFVRSPWSYYVSWYSFQSARASPNALFRTLSREGTLSFAATVRNMLALGEDDDLLDAVLAALPTEYTNTGLNLPRQALAQIRGSGLGFYSFLYKHILDGDPAPLIGRMEHLRQEFPALLTRLGQPLSGPFLDHIRGAPSLNVSSHGCVASFYDASLAELVGERDGLIIERHSYRLPSD